MTSNIDDLSHLQMHVPADNDEASSVVEFQQRCQDVLARAQREMPAIPLGLMAHVRGPQPILIEMLVTPGHSKVWIFGFCGHVDGNYVRCALWTSDHGVPGSAIVIAESTSVPDLTAAIAMADDIIQEMRVTAIEAEYYAGLKAAGITPEAERMGRLVAGGKALDAGLSVDAHVRGKLN